MLTFIRAKNYSYFLKNGGLMSSPRIGTQADQMIRLFFGGGKVISEGYKKFESQKFCVIIQEKPAENNLPYHLQITVSEQGPSQCHHIYTLKNESVNSDSDLAIEWAIEDAFTVLRNGESRREFGSRGSEASQKLFSSTEKKLHDLADGRIKAETVDDFLHCFKDDNAAIPAGSPMETPQKFTKELPVSTRGAGTADDNAKKEQKGCCSLL